MAFAYFIAHAPRGNLLVPLLNGGEPAVLYCFIFLFFAAAGGGRWAVDNLAVTPPVAADAAADAAVTTQLPGPDRSTPLPARRAGAR